MSSLLPSCCISFVFNTEYPVLDNNPHAYKIHILGWMNSGSQSRYSIPLFFFVFSRIQELNDGNVIILWRMKDVRVRFGMDI